MDADNQVKVLIVGAAGVGKTCIVNRIVRNEFENTETTTLQNITSTTLTHGNQSVQIQIFDIAGSEQYRDIVGNFFHFAKLALIVFSIDSERSFQDVDKWLEKIKEFFVIENKDDNDYISLILVGTKNDLSDEREVLESNAENKAKEINPLVEYIEVSSLTGDGIKHLKDQIAQLAISSNKIAFHEKIVKPIQEEDTDPKKRCC